MRSNRHRVFARASILCGLLVLASAQGACFVDIKDGVYACAVTSDCPSGLRCDAISKHCTRQAPSSAQTESSDKPDAAARGASTGAVSERPKDAGQAADRSPASDKHADAAPAREPMDGGPQRADAGAAARPAVDAGSGPMQQQPDRAGTAGANGAHGANDTAGANGANGGAGARAEQAGAAAASGAAGSGTEPASGSATACGQGAYCYGFEAGPLDPSGALWPSPSRGSGELPPYGELTTTAYPASSQNKVLVSRPSARDGWPKATVGFSGPAAPFSKLVVSFDYVAGEKLVDPDPRVILFRFVGVPNGNADSVNIGLLNRDAMLEVQMDGPDPLTSIGPASAPGTLTHVSATFTRKPPSCSVEAVYGELPLKAAAFPCQVDRWQIELGLDLLETPPEQYTQDYSAFFDNLQITTTP